MDVLCHAKNLCERFTVQINKTANIEWQNVEQIRARIQELKRDLIKNKEIAQEMIKEINESVELNPKERRKLEEQIRKLEENEADDQKRFAQLEKEIFAQDSRIEKLSENLNGFRVQLAVTENKLEETQNELTDTRNDLMKTKNDHEMTKNELKRMESALKTGQIAFVFEKDLATYIYPHDKKFGPAKYLRR